MLFSCLPKKVFSQDRPQIVSLKGSQDYLLIRSGTYFLEDASDTFDFKTVVSSKNWQLNKIGVPNFSVTNSAYWIRIRLANQTDKHRLILKIAAPILDSVQVYKIVNGSSERVYNLGEGTSIALRPYNSTDFLIPLKLAKDSSISLYIKIKNGDNLQVPLIIGTEANILKQDKQKDFFWAVYIGLLLSMIVYNLFLSISVKEQNYLSYVVYLIAVLFTQISIQGYYSYIFPESNWLNTHIATFMPSLAGITGIYFLQQFLHTKETVPKLNKWFLPFYVTYIISFLLVIFNEIHYGFLLAEITAISVSFFMMYVAGLLSYKGDRSAKFYSIAWGTFLLGVILYTLKDYNILPYNNFTLYTMPVGSALETILLSFALADKINVLKMEKAISQANALRAAQKNTQLISGQNAVLESKVNERTLELTNALATLKSAQTQLVESEKMASLGQLTAGIAHEINNPINFVISNVKPLKRDIKLLTDAIVQIEGIYTSGGDGLKSHEQRLSALKEEIEYDYLLTEIDYLLKGITEGSERTAEIVKGLRIFARVDESDVKMTNIHEGLNATITIINALMGDKIVLDRFYGSVSSIECYPGKLNQAFLNIITNGIHAISAKFGSQPGGKLTIKTWNADGIFHVSIADNGSGIPDKIANRIYEPFFSTKDIGEGTGLGLAIAYNIVKKHNGEIVFHTKVNEGTEFVISLPEKQV